MPAVSQAQRALLNARFGHAWVKKHHFDNRGPLPQRAASAKGGRTMGGYPSGDLMKSTTPLKAGAKAAPQKQGKPKAAKKSGKKAGHAKYGHTKPDGFGGLKTC